MNLEQLIIIKYRSSAHLWHGTFHPSHCFGLPVVPQFKTSPLSSPSSNHSSILPRGLQPWGAGSLLRPLRCSMPASKEHVRPNASYTLPLGAKSITFAASPAPAGSIWELERLAWNPGLPVWPCDVLLTQLPDWSNDPVVCYNLSFVLKQ